MLPSWRGVSAGQLVRGDVGELRADRLDGPQGPAGGHPGHDGDQQDRDGQPGEQERVDRRDRVVGRHGRGQHVDQDVPAARVAPAQVRRQLRARVRRPGHDQGDVAVVGAAPVGAGRRAEVDGDGPGPAVIHRGVQRQAQAGVPEVELEFLVGVQDLAAVQDDGEGLQGVNRPQWAAWSEPSRSSAGRSTGRWVLLSATTAIGRSGSKPTNELKPPVPPLCQSCA